MHTKEGQGEASGTEPSAAVPSGREDWQQEGRHAYLTLRQKPDAEQHTEVTTLPCGRELIKMERWGKCQSICPFVLVNLLTKIFCLYFFT